MKLEWLVAPEIKEIPKEWWTRDKMPQEPLEGATTGQLWGNLRINGKQ